MMITVQNVLMGMMISLKRGDNVLNSINKIVEVVDGMRCRVEFHQQKRGSCRCNTKRHNKKRAMQTLHRSFFVILQVCL